MQFLIDKHTLVVWPVVNTFCILPNLLLLRKTICHEELQNDTLTMESENPKNDCSSKQIVVYRGE